MTGDLPGAVTTRPYDPDRDGGSLWDLKRAFETEMGDTGGPDKQAAYDAKLTSDYRDEWLDWVDRCVSETRRTVTLAVDQETSPPTDPGRARPDPDIVGYVFVLPESLAFVWDAAVLNELYVRPEYRGTGVADALMETAVELAREQSLPIDRLVLDVDRANERARQFYTRHGFGHWGEMLAKDL